MCCLLLNMHPPSWKKLISLSFFGKLAAPVHSDLVQMELRPTLALGWVFSSLNRSHSLDPVFGLELCRWPKLVQSKRPTEQADRISPTIKMQVKSRLACFATVRGACLRLVTTQRELIESRLSQAHSFPVECSVTLPITFLFFPPLINFV